MWFSKLIVKKWQLALSTDENLTVAFVGRGFNKGWNLYLQCTMAGAPFIWIAHSLSHDNHILKKNMTAIGISWSHYSLWRFIRQKLCFCIVVNIFNVKEWPSWMCAPLASLVLCWTCCLGNLFIWSVTRRDKVSLPYVHLVVSFDQERGCNLIISYDDAYSTFSTWKYNSSIVYVFFNLWNPLYRQVR
jgi:hypothetical protein